MEEGRPGRLVDVESILFRPQFHLDPVDQAIYHYVYVNVNNAELGKNPQEMGW